MDRNKSVRIRKISVRDYKGVDELEMEFPEPRMPGDPDILVMGSGNGVGKTVVIECLSLLSFAFDLREKSSNSRNGYSTVDAPDLLIKAGSRFAEISGEIAIGDEAVSVQVRIERDGTVKITGASPREKWLEEDPFDPESEVDDFIKAICGFTPNPVIGNKFLLFHGYRKVQEGNLDLGMMVKRGRLPRRQAFQRDEFPVSAFKLEVLRSLTRESNMFESVEGHEPGEAIEKLNELTRFYAGGALGKPRLSSDNAVDIRVKPINGDESFSFDALSSGQKEIVSTLFLIWLHTKNKPSIALIDEPELHLNAQWRRGFVNNLVSLAPRNQYIMATHSEDIMDSVGKDRRILLLSINDGGK
ncbi:MAG: ATP-binding protein [Deltaproteobacteria bacterium]|nr:ATP-binding protein [Deltaproteobacteria bacterium]